MTNREPTTHTQPKMSNPEHYEVKLSNGDELTFDRVIVMDGGWLSCYVTPPSGGKVNYKYPPHRVEEVTAEYENAGPRTKTADERLEEA